MAKFGWAYIDCSGSGDTGSGSAGPNGSLQFVTASGPGHTTGSVHLTFYTSSYAGYTANSLILSGNMYVTGTVSASVFHVKDVSIIDATGSTYFGDSLDDTHQRSGSLIVTAGVTRGSLSYILSASSAEERVWVRAFGGRYHKVIGATYTIGTFDYILGVSGNINQTLYLPSASAVGAGAIVIIKDEATNRGAKSIYISASVPPGNFTVDDISYYELTGSHSAISLYSNGTNWYVF
jgi:hypothetical protein